MSSAQRQVISANAGPVTEEAALAEAKTSKPEEFKRWIEVAGRLHKLAQREV
jgi:hypothetical protein